MKRRYRPSSDGSEQRTMQKVDMEMQNVEFLSTTADLFQHDEGSRDRGFVATVQAQGPVRTTDQLGRGLAVATREQCHVVADAHQLLRQVTDDSFGAAIASWGNALYERGNLGDFHSTEDTSLAQKLLISEKPMKIQMNVSACLALFYPDLVYYW